MWLHRLSVHSSDGELLWQWLASESCDGSEHSAPCNSANLETQLLPPHAEGSSGLGVLCEGHDPALLINLPADVLALVSGRSSLTVEGSWELLSREVSHLLGVTQAQSPDN